MSKKLSNCEEEETQEGVNIGNFKLSIWAQQLENFREIVINEDITDLLVEKAILQVMNINRYDDQMEAQVVDYVREPIVIMLNTGGGELDAALSLCSCMEMSKTPVHTVALGKACSAGFLILICGHRRFAQQYSRLMYHTGSSGYIGVITDILEHGDYLESLNDMIHGIVLEHTDITEEQLDDVFLRKSDWYLTIQDALDLGVIDWIWGAEYPDEDEDEDDAECADDGYEDEVAGEDGESYGCACNCSHQ